MTNRKPSEVDKSKITGRPRNYKNKKMTIEPVYMPEELVCKKRRIGNMGVVQLIEDCDK